MDKIGKFQWYWRCLSDETRSGLKPIYKYVASIHFVGGISRRGATKLMIFSGYQNVDSRQFASKNDY